jgi:PAS domain S-box-containing protein
VPKISGGRGAKETAARRNKRVPNGGSSRRTIEGEVHRRVVHELKIRQAELEAQNDMFHDAQTVLEQSRARYAELYDAAPVGHFTMDRLGIIREANLAGAALVGVERSRLQGCPMRALVIPADRAAFEAHLRHCIVNREPAMLETSVRLPDGGTRRVELVTIAASHHSYSGGSLFHTAVLERRSSTREELLALVSHELRGPLQPMRLWLRALRAGGAGDDLRARALDALDACLEIQVAMIDDLVDAARGHRRQLRVDLQELDLRPIVTSAVDALAASAANKQIELSVDLDPEPARIAGDATRLRQITSNLVLNAFKHTREAGIVDVSVAASGPKSCSPFATTARASSATSSRASSNPSESWGRGRRAATRTSGSGSPSCANWSCSMAATSGRRAPAVAVGPSSPCEFRHRTALD